MIYRNDLVYYLETNLVCIEYEALSWQSGQGEFQSQHRLEATALILRGALSPIYTLFLIWNQHVTWTCSSLWIQDKKRISLVTYDRRNEGVVNDSEAWRTFNNVNNQHFSHPTSTQEGSTFSWLCSILLIVYTYIINIDTCTKYRTSPSHSSRFYHLIPDRSNYTYIHTFIHFHT